MSEVGWDGKVVGCECVLGVVDVDYHFHIRVNGFEQAHHVGEFVLAGAFDVLLVHHRGFHKQLHAVFKLVALGAGDGWFAEVQFAVGIVFVEQTAVEFVRINNFVRQLHHEGVAAELVAHSLEVVLHGDACLDAVHLAHAADGVGVDGFVNYFQGVVAHHCFHVFNLGGEVVVHAVDKIVVIAPHAQAHQYHGGNEHDCVFQNRFQHFGICQQGGVYDALLHFFYFLKVITGE